MFNRMVKGFCLCFLLISTQVYGHTSHNTCSTPGLADSYILAISWQPAFCETNKTKDECKKMEAKYASNPENGPRFTLHGLWPNQKSCGINYGYCDKKNTELKLLPQVSEELAKVMPNLAFGGNLPQYEWNKHGTCQNTWDQNQYFTVATNLVKEFANATSIRKFIAENVATLVTKDEFIAALSEDFGETFINNVTLQCKNNMLAEIRINLPKDIKAGETLAALMNRASGTGLNSGNCQDEFVIDQWGVPIDAELSNSYRIN